MRISRSILIFSILNLIGVIAFIYFLPETVIFGFTGSLYASEFIGKWYNLMIPVIQVIITLIIFLVDIFNPNPHRYRYLTSWVAVSFTTYIVWVMLFLQYENFELGVKLTWPWTVIILFPFALFMLAEGFYTINKAIDDFSIFGLKWVRNNANVWKNTHRTAGKSLILVSILFIVISILNEVAI